MTIKLLLTIGLGCAAAYAMLQPTTLRALRFIVVLVTVVGVLFVWFPSSSTLVAQVVGVGRGADLVLYCWVVASVFVMINLHVKNRQLNTRVTELARHVALREAKAADSAASADQ